MRYWISLKDVGYSTYILPTSKDKIKASKKLLKNVDLDKIKIIYGHGVPYGIHKFINHRKVRYFTFVRDPIKRLPSIFNHKARLFKQTNNMSEELMINLKNTLLISNKIPSFSKWVKLRFATKPENEFLSTYNYLKIFGYKLKDFYFIGKTSEYNNDSLHLFGILGMNKYFFDRNISTIHYEGNVNAEVEELILNKAKKDMKLFEEAMKIRSKFIKRKEYLRIVKLKKIQKFFFLPITQILFAPRSAIKRLLIPESKSEV